jgi:vacuolar-type H+-ATPase subunit I/STV1
MFPSLRRTAVRTARRTALSLGAGIAFIVGAVFLTIAAWIFLVAAYGALVAAFILGLIYLGLAAILLGTAMSHAAPDHPHSACDCDATRSQPTPPEGMPPLVEAFIFGLSAALKSGKS